MTYFHIEQFLCPNFHFYLKGTAQLKEEVNNPESIGILCKLLSLHQDPNIRQYAAIILKKRFVKKNKWVPVDPQLKAEYVLFYS